ncbi:hypothetical protein [Pseudomonas capsici]|uniref:hypothetical protein n=1 Tax=Pseudomonas capsici TaxID=2810614 RepID=UPI0021F0F9F8|nr:hypothetical protein [Pseudomonas capsici]
MILKNQEKQLVQQEARPLLAKASDTASPALHPTDKAPKNAPYSYKYLSVRPTKKHTPAQLG